MTSDLDVGCTCGSLRGMARGISGDIGNRVICYCDDCQSFAWCSAIALVPFAIVFAALGAGLA